MDLIALAVPFFLLALFAEMVVDRKRGRGYFRTSDTVNSLSAGALSTTIGYFTNLLPVYMSGFVFSHFAILDIDASLFDLSPRGLFFWLLAIVAWDFCYYWAHRAGHEISILWAAHSVHHQSEEYNLSTALRQTSTGFLFGWVFYLPLFLLGLPIEVVATANAIDLIYQFWVHTRHIDRLGWADRVFITPSNHRVHHAQNERYIDKNYGGILVLWDRLFGTFQDELDDDPVVFGVRKPLASWNPFWANLQVYDYLLRDARRTARWRDKLGIWFRRTGWRPADVEADAPRPNRDLGRFRKYSPRVPTALQRYVVAQFVFAIAVVLVIGVVYARYGALEALVPCVFLWLLLFSLGRLLENRDAAVRLEVLRVVVATPLLAVLLLSVSSLPLSLTPFALGVVAYALSSLTMLVLALRTPEHPDGGQADDADGTSVEAQAR